MSRGLRGGRFVVDDFEHIAVEADNADRILFGDGSAGGGLPDFSLDEDAADGEGIAGPDGFHGGAKGAYEGGWAGEGLVAAGCQREAQQQEGDGSESDAQADGDGRLNGQLGDGRVDQRERAEGEANGAGEGEDFASLAQEVDEIAAVAAAGIQDAHGGGDVAAQDLVEDVDVDLAEFFLQSEWNGAAPGVILGGPRCRRFVVDNF